MKGKLTGTQFCKPVHPLGHFRAQIGRLLPLGLSHSSHHSLGRLVESEGTLCARHACPPFPFIEKQQNQSGI